MSYPPPTSPAQRSYYPGDEIRVRMTFTHDAPIFAVRVVYAHPDDPTYALVLRGNPEPAEGSATTGPEKRSAVELTEVVDEEMITGAYRPVRVMFYPHSGCAFSAEPNLLGE